MNQPITIPTNQPITTSTSQQPTNQPITQQPTNQPITIPTDDEEKRDELAKSINYWEMRNVSVGGVKLKFYPPSPSLSPGLVLTENYEFPLTDFEKRNLSAHVSIHSHESATFILGASSRIFSCGAVKGWSDMSNKDEWRFRSYPQFKFSKIEKLCVGNAHSVILLSNGETWGIGQNRNFQLSRNVNSDHSNWVKILPQVKHVACNCFRSWFVKEDEMLNHQLWLYGKQLFQMDFRSIEFDYTPTIVDHSFFNTQAQTFKIKQLEACFLNKQYIISEEPSSQTRLHSLSCESNSCSTKVEMENVQLVSCQTHHALVLTSDHRVYTKGDGPSGRMDVTSSWNSWTQVDTSAITSPIIKVQASWKYSLLLTESLDLYIFGGQDVLSVFIHPTIPDLPLPTLVTNFVGFYTYKSPFSPAFVTFGISASGILYSQTTGNFGSDCKPPSPKKEVTGISFVLNDPHEGVPVLSLVDTSIEKVFRSDGSMYYSEQDGVYAFLPMIPYEGDKVLIREAYYHQQTGPLNNQYTAFSSKSSVPELSTLHCMNSMNRIQVIEEISTRNARVVRAVAPETVWVITYDGELFAIRCDKPPEALRDEVFAKVQPPPPSKAIQAGYSSQFAILLCEDRIQIRTVFNTSEIEDKIYRELPSHDIPFDLLSVATIVAGTKDIIFLVHEHRPRQSYSGNTILQPTRGLLWSYSIQNGNWTEIRHDLRFHLLVSRDDMHAAVTNNHEIYVWGKAYYTESCMGSKYIEQPMFAANTEKIKVSKMYVNPKHIRMISGVDCFGIPSHDDNVCSRNGICVAHNQCQCREGYYGYNCFADFECDGRMDANFKGGCVRGTCKRRVKSDGSVEGYCSCPSLYTGKTCSGKNGFIALFVPLSIFVFFVFTCVLCCLIFCASGCFVCCFGVSLTYYKRKSVRAGVELSLLRNQIDNYEVLDDDENGARVKIDTNLFNIPFEELKIVSKLGAGGSGSIVFLCRWQNSDVACKVYKTSNISGDFFTDEFNHEASLMASLFHPNIVRFYGVSLKASRIAMILEYANLGSLEEYISNQKSKLLSWKQRNKLLIDICNGMIFLHNKHVIHRDLKSANVLLFGSEKADTAKIVDFGLSKKITENNNSQHTSRIGTSYTMAPEVIRGENYNFKADVYSFSMIMYEMLTQEVNPFGSDSGIGIEYKVASQGLRPSLCCISVRADRFWFIALMKRCWSENPDRRPSFLEILEEFQENYEQMEDIDEEEELPQVELPEEAHETHECTLEPNQTLRSLSSSDLLNNEEQE